MNVDLSDIDNIQPFMENIFSKEDLQTKEENLEIIIQSLVSPRVSDNILNHNLALIANIIKLVIEERIINANIILCMLVKHTYNFRGLLLIGLVVRHGANPNVYLNITGRGIIHILCALAVRRDSLDPYFRYVCALLRALGSNIKLSAENSKDIEERPFDYNFVQKMNTDLKLKDYSLTVEDYVREQSKIPDEDFIDFISSIDKLNALYVILGIDNVELFEQVVSDPQMRENYNLRLEDNIKLVIDISIASAMNIANELVTSKFGQINKLYNLQPIPILIATIAFDKEMFKLMASKGTAIKYLTITNLITNYKKFKESKIAIYKNAFQMLVDAINIGADIDLYQFELFTSSADYSEIEELKKAYSVPKWKKLCAVHNEEPRQELKQIAFELNLDYNMSEEKICNKLKQISMLEMSQFLNAAITRQEDRITSELSTNTDYLGNDKPARSRCAKKSTVITNPYAYNDGRMSFYRDPESGEIWCFTSDTFSNLISTKRNPYTGKKLPEKFIETIKGQLNILREIGVYDYNRSMKDTLKEYFERENINNKKIDYAYNTVIKCLSLYGMSEERFTSLSEGTLQDIILRDICDISIDYFGKLIPKHQIMLTARVIYSLSKSSIKDENIYREVASVVTGNIEEEINEAPEDAINEYMDMLE